MKSALALISFLCFQPAVFAAGGEEPRGRIGIKLPNIEGKVVAVNRDYGFIIINAGAATGLKKGDVVDLWFQGKVVGQARIVQVEEKIAVADLVRENEANPFPENIGNWVFTPKPKK